MDKLQCSNKYMYDNIKNSNPRYRHKYHAMSPIGWVNDPNGFSYFMDNIHLFFQYNPFNNHWGPMHWGHYISKDFIKWELKPIALAPDKDYDKDLGAFSGSIIEKDDVIYLFYTGVANGYQQQCLAVSTDGLTFTKYDNNPIISKDMLPNIYSKYDFRDPYVFKNNDKYYVLMGTKKEEYGNILLYESNDLKNWNFKGELMNSSYKNLNNFYELNGVYECPSFTNIDGKDLLICSPQYLPTDGTNFENIYSVVYMIGELDYSTGRFKYDKFNDLDGGFDFYAAQIMKYKDNRTIMTAWMQMWDRSLPTQNDNWVGAFILPRELTIKENHLYQNPVRELNNYRKNKIEINKIVINNESKSFEKVNGNVIDLEFTLNTLDSKIAGVKLFKGEKHETLLYYDKENKKVVFDRSNSGIEIKGREENNNTRSIALDLNDNKIKFRILLDVTSVEIFINDGYYAMTSNVYPDELDLGIEFYSVEGKTEIEQLIKYDIEVI